MSHGKFVKARKNHRCTFCCNKIYKDVQYWYERITPWDHSDNDGYSILKAHARCIETWYAVGAECDWEFPDDPGFWRESMVDVWLRKKRKALGLCEEHRKERPPVATQFGMIYDFGQVPRGRGGVCDGCAKYLSLYGRFKPEQPTEEKTA